MVGFSSCRDRVRFETADLAGVAVEDAVVSKDGGYVFAPVLRVSAWMVAGYGDRGCALVFLPSRDLGERFRDSEGREKMF